MHTIWITQKGSRERATVHVPMHRTVGTSHAQGKMGRKRSENTVFIIHSWSCEKRGQANDRCTQLSPAFQEFKSSPRQVYGEEKFLSFQQSWDSGRELVSKQGKKCLPLKVREGTGIKKKKTARGGVTIVKSKLSESLANLWVTVCQLLQRGQSERETGMASRQAY